jgi:acyl-CoA synthetase (AMP-forming)/AMP-acid ligase II
MNAAGYVLGSVAIAGPAKPAIVCGDDSVTHGELAVRVARFAAGLREAGLNPGDRVACSCATTPITWRAISL